MQERAAGVEEDEEDLGYFGDAPSAGSRSALSCWVSVDRDGEGAAGWDVQLPPDFKVTFER